MKLAHEASYERNETTLLESHAAHLMMRFAASEGLNGRASSARLRLVTTLTQKISEECTHPYGLAVARRRRDWSLTLR